MELVEQQDLDTLEERILDHLAEEDPFRDVADAGLRAGDVFKADLVTDFAAEGHVQLFGDASGEEAGCEAAGLEDDGLTPFESALREQDLGYLGRLAGAGGRLDDEAPVGGDGMKKLGFELVDGQSIHDRPPRAAMGLRTSLRLRRASLGV